MRGSTPTITDAVPHRFPDGGDNEHGGQPGPAIPSPTSRAIS
jgi:hypothetical protein